MAEEKKPELYIECALYINGAPFGLPMTTRFLFLFYYEILHFGDLISF